MICYRWLYAHPDRRALAFYTRPMTSRGIMVRCYLWLAARNLYVETCNAVRAV